MRRDKYNDDESKYIECRHGGMDTMRAKGERQ